MSVAYVRTDIKEEELEPALVQSFQASRDDLGSIKRDSIKADVLRQLGLFYRRSSANPSSNTKKGLLRRGVAGAQQMQATVNSHSATTMLQGFITTRF
jgi:hypothetical protein